MSALPSLPLLNPASNRSALDGALAEVARVLPDQGPIGVFVAQNPLFAFQDRPYHSAVAEARARLGVQGYLSEPAFRTHVRTGRIRGSDIDAALAGHRAHQAGPVGLGLDGAAIDRAVMFHTLVDEPWESMIWSIEENAASRRLRADLDAGHRDRLVREGRDAFDALLDTLGNTRSFAEIAEILTGRPKLSAIRRALATPRGRRWWPRTTRRNLAELGFAGASAEAYLAFLDARAPGRAADWIAAEVDEVMPAIARQFGRTGSVPDLLRLARTDPEAVVTSWLWGVARTTPPREPKPRIVATFPTRRIAELCGEDTDPMVASQFVPWLAAYLDEGQSDWPLPERDAGLFRCWRQYASLHRVEPWLRDLPARVAALPADPAGALEATLHELSVPTRRWASFLLDVARPLRGWAGMMTHLERAPEHATRGAPPATLADFLAVRLQYDVVAWRWIAREKLFFAGPASALPGHLASLPTPRPHRTQHPLTDAWTLFHLAQITGVTPARLLDADRAERHRVLDAVDAFGTTSRAVVWQEAFERGYREPVLAAIAANRADPTHPTAPSAQVLFCMDDREEAIRRHLEEVAPTVETLGVAGFFGVAMQFRGLDDAAADPLCPIVVTPAHAVDEVPVAGHEHRAHTRAVRRFALARARWWFDRRSRGLVFAHLLAVLTGWFSMIPFAARVFAPRLVANVGRAVERRLVPLPRTALTTHAVGHLAADGRPIGFTLDEQVARVRAVLENVGLIKNFGRFVVLVGHGSASVNNPHRSAYDCGACGGRPGGPSARAFAAMANHPEVRAALADTGIAIPATTWFVAAMHNTCTDAVEVLDLPEDQRDTQAWSALWGALEAARRLSAHERCRRFASAPRDPSLDEALAHVEARAEDLAEARPELGHATNALCVVGRRTLTRGLFLDRRAFLVSYDPTIDPDGEILGRVLAAAGPVGAGINLAYTFSCVDNRALGAGSKLPHNLTALIGVMDGTTSDLRVGLPRQMVEIHEPMRLLVVCESTPAILARVLDRQPGVAQLVRNAWIRVAAVDPDDGQMWLFDPDLGFQPCIPDAPAPASATRSTAWYRWHQGCLAPARIRGGACAIPPHREHAR